MGGVELDRNKHTRRDHALICFSKDELQKKKIALGGGACIRIADQNYVMRTVKETGAKAWAVILCLHGYARRPTGCMSERIDVAGSNGGAPR